MSAPRIGVVGATGAVGTITLELLAERGHERVRAFASARSAGSQLPFGDRGAMTVEEATPEALGAGDVDLFLFSVGTSASRELVPVASAAGAICIDKSSAYRLVDGYPLVVPEVNADRALEALERDRIVANPNCCTIPLTCVLKPLHEAAGLRRVHVVDLPVRLGRGRPADGAPRRRGSAATHDLVMDWSWEGDESDEESKLRAETRKIMELPDLPLSATCVRVPGDGRPLRGGVDRARGAALPRAGGVDPARRAERARARPACLPDARPGGGRRRGARRPDPARHGAAENGIALYLSCDNLRKGAALNAIQIADVLLGAVAAR